MKKIIVLGTLHSNWTPKEELEEVLNNIKPDKVFVELSDAELNDRPRKDSIRDEMFVAYDWAMVNRIPVQVFDVEDSPLKDGVTGKEPEFLEYELKCRELLKDYSWKDLNREEPWKMTKVRELEATIVEKYFDTKKSSDREHLMLTNVKRGLVNGKNAIVTGAGHLTFFKKELPQAVLPFRS